jgi:long-chain acyl-CoA synthetase
MSIVHNFLQTVAATPEACAIQDGQQKISYGQLAVLAQRAAGVISDATTRDRLGIYLPASGGFFISFLGTLAAGKVAVPLNLFLAPEELSAIIAHSGIDLVITCSQLAEKLDGIAVKTILAEELPAGPEESQPAPADLDDLAVLLYTSGSTGSPKGVRLSHRNLLANANAAAKATGFRPEDVVLGALPPFHTFALTTTVLAPLLSGASVVNTPRFHPENALDLMAAEGISVLLGVPSMYRLMARAQKSKPRNLKNLRLVASGGERLPEKIRRKFEQAFGVEICEGYGMTECSPVVAINRPDRNKPGTVGPPLEHLEVVIVDDDGQHLPADSDGEIWVRGDSVMAGYLDNEAETEKALHPDGWLRTGDIGRLDTDGFLSITGRIKELIIVGGENVHPSEVEDAALSHPGVAECSAIGIENEQRGEQIVLAVVSAAQKPATPDEIKAHCRQLLAAYKIPRKIIILEELPKGHTGKVNRQLLTKLLKESLN